MTQQPMGRFLEACGAAGPLELGVEDASGLDLGRWAVPQPFALIGRDPKAELALDGEAVSRRHAYLQVVGGRVFCVDLGSRVGITLGRSVEPSGWLDPGEAIGVGPYRVRLERGGPGRAASEPAPNPLATDVQGGPGAEPPAMALEISRRVDGPPRWRVKWMLTLVGRGSDCRLKIQDDSISRFHCALLRTPGGAWVVDLLSREGVRVNGARVRWAPLDDGDQLHVGRYRLVVRLGDPGVLAAESASGSDYGNLPPLPRDQFPAILSGVAPPARKAAAGGLRRALESRPLEPAEQAEALLEPLVQQFGQMQQQMFDQFHQAMMAMFQMFGSMQRDQMGTVREELERIRQLGQELQALQTQQFRAGAPDPPAPIGPGPEVALPPGAPARDASGSGPVDGQTTAAEGPDRLAPRRDPESPAGTPSRPPVPLSTEPPEDLHARLARRMAEIQGERQTRLQRLVALMTGGNAPSP